MSAFNDRVIAEFRANGGVVNGFGNRLVLLHSVGADRLIIASARGATSNPGWYFNLKAHPDASIEGGRKASVINVIATELTGADYTAARQ
jgi:hypothetical protein